MGLRQEFDIDGGALWKLVQTRIQFIAEKFDFSKNFKRYGVSGKWNYTEICKVLQDYHTLFLLEHFLWAWKLFLSHTFMVAINTPDNVNNFRANGICWIYQPTASNRIFTQFFLNRFQSLAKRWAHFRMIFYWTRCNQRATRNRKSCPNEKRNQISEKKPLIKINIQNGTYIKHSKAKRMRLKWNLVKKCTFFANSSQSNKSIVYYSLVSHIYIHFPIENDAVDIFVCRRCFSLNFHAQYE